MTRLAKHADSWRATLDDHLDVIRAEILDLIDLGLTGIPVIPRKPTTVEQLATDRSDGHFQPTPKAAGRTSGTSDPTLRQVLAWEGEVQDAVTRLFELVRAALEVADGLGLVPVNQDGDQLDAPEEPPTRVTQTGRVVVDAGPGECRRVTIAAVAYVAAVADRLADRMRTATDLEVTDALLDRSSWIEQSVAGLARRLRPDPVRRCAAGCGGAAPPRGQGATCGRCRTARWRESQEAS